MTLISLNISTVNIELFSFFVLQDFQINPAKIVNRKKIFLHFYMKYTFFCLQKENNFLKNSEFHFPISKHKILILS